MAQIHQCLLRWNLLKNPRIPATNSSTDQDWELSPKNSSRSSKSYSTSSKPIAGPQDIERYLRRPLPPLPSRTDSIYQTSSKDTRSIEKKSHDTEQSNVTSSFGYESIKSEIEFPLNSTSSFEHYVLDDDAHSHGYLAMGSDCIPRTMGNRGRDAESSGGRTYRPARRSKKDRSSERNAKRK